MRIYLGENGLKRARSDALRGEISYEMLAAVTRSLQREPRHMTAREKAAEARGRILDEWMEYLYNGPGLDEGQVRALYEDARTMAIECDRMNFRLLHNLGPDPT